MEYLIGYDIDKIKFIIGSAQVTGYFKDLTNNDLYLKTEADIEGRKIYSIFLIDQNTRLKKILGSNDVKIITQKIYA